VALLLVVHATVELVLPVLMHVKIEVDRLREYGWMEEWKEKGREVGLRE
jgi:hypothetical protein